MPKQFIKENGTWREVLAQYAKDRGVWRPIRKVWIKDNGVWRQVFGNSGSITQLTPGTYSFTVPAGVYSINVTACGGGGSGGSGDGGANNSGPGWGGGGSNLISSVLSVTPGQVLTLVVGAGGLGSYGGGGKAGYPTRVTGTGVSFISAGGGGGASKDGWGPTGEISPGVLDTVYRGGAGANGANSGVRPTAGTSTNGGANGGEGGPYNMQAGGNGGNGKLYITY